MNKKMNDMAVKRIVRKPLRSHISIRVSEELLSWMDKKEYSATLIFREACKDLGYKGNE